MMMLRYVASVTVSAGENSKQVAAMGELISVRRGTI